MVSSDGVSNPPVKRSPLASITNYLPGSTPKSSSILNSPLSKHLEPIETPVKPKTGRARVLTSMECIELLEEKKRKKEQEASEKEERKKERERKKLEREELARKKAEARRSCSHEEEGSRS